MSGKLGVGKLAQFKLGASTAEDVAILTGHFDRPSPSQTVVS